MGSDTATVSLRLPVGLHKASRELAARRGMSLNALVLEGLAALIDAEEEKRFFDSFTLLGQDEECNAGFALPAQREVVLGDTAQE